MQNWKNFPRFIIFIALLTSLLASLSVPVFVDESVHAAPMRAVLPGDVVISEFRFLGPAGADDEFIELYNPKNSSVDISGLKIMGSNNTGGTSTRATLGSVTLQPGQYYLLVNNNASSGLLTLQNTTYSTGITADGGIALTLNDGTTIIDAVGLSIGSAYKEGATLTPLSGSANQSYERKVGGLYDSCQDANINSSDFQLINPSAPQNLSTPRRLCGISSDLSINQIVDNTTPSVGTNVVFTITLTNNGPNDATNVTVKDLLPAGLTYVSNDLGAAYNSGTGIWTVGTLISGASATLNITVFATTPGGKTNWAEVWNSDQIDPDSIAGNSSTTEDDDASATVSPPVTDTLNITNVVNNLNPTVGSNVVFTITVTNPSASPFNATNVNVAALLPIGLTYISNDLGAAYSSGTGVWTVGNLVIGASTTLNITAKVTANNPPSYSATVSSIEFINSTSTVTINNPLSGEANLSLTHDPIVVSTTIADQVSLKLRLHNAGPDVATDIQVKDLLPSGLTYVSYASTSGTTYSNSTGIWAVGSLASGADATLTIAVKVSSSGTSTSNFAEVWQSDQYDPNSTTGNGELGEDDDTSLEVIVADLRVSETVDIAGSNAVFTITVNNAGPDDASNVTIKNSKLASITSYTHVSHNSTAGTSYNTATGDWTIPALLDGASATLTVTTTIVSTDVNWAQVSAVTEVDPDSVPANCSNTVASCKEDDDAAAPAADLFLMQSVNNANPDVGTNVVFTITVSNAGVAGTTNVQVKDLLPSGLTYVSYASTSSTTYSNSTGIWTIGTLANGASRTLNITAKVAASGVNTNWAEVWISDESDPDSIPGNGSTTEDDDASATITSYRSIIINEVAWSGTAASANDEWIELYNPGSASISITGWILKSASSCSSAPGSLNITLSGTISAGGYFLLEREDNSTVSDVTADQIYPGALLNILSDTGEALILCDGSGNFIDTANGNGGAWPKGGTSPNFGSMERKGASAENDGSWGTNLGNPKNGKDANNGLIYGTPRKVNSSGVAAPTPTKPAPTATAVPLQPVGRPVINEFLPRPGFDWNQDGQVDVFDEFIEIKNLGPVDISMKGWRLDDDENKGSAPFTIPDVVLKPGERLVFYGLQTNILLSDGGDTVRLLNPSNIVYDAYTYKIAKVEDESICRLPDSNLFGAWYEDCTPTPNLLNTRDGTVPSMPENGFESPVCDLPDTLPADFLFAECHGYGAKIWNAYFWDKESWQGDRYVPENMSKWESFVE